MHSVDLLKPRLVEIEKKTSTRAVVVVEPLERGYGHTLGNSLRRILLSSIDGYAITEVKLDGVLHEYSVIEGVQEDVINIILNFKEVSLKLDDRDQAEIYFTKKGPGVFTAGDIAQATGITVANPNLEIAHLNKDIELGVNLKIEYGRGYQPVSMRVREGHSQVGTLKLDASFNPILNVSYSVENARVEQLLCFNRW